MNKYLRSFLAIGAILVSSSVATAEYALDGYYRIQSAATNKYVQLTGPFSAAPNQDFNQAVTEAGSVFYIKAVQDKNLQGKQALRLINLRTQGVDVVGGEEHYSYDQFFDDLMNSGLEFNETAVYNITKLGFDHGYINVGRAAIEFMIYFMGNYLNENYKPAEDASVDLEALTKDFIEVVAENINLNLYLEPDGKGGVRLYYDIPDLQACVDWYLNPANKERFEVGFKAMRVGLTSRGINTGEYLSDDEIEWMAKYGYVLPEKYKTEVVELYGGPQFYVPYEKIFADKDLLFAWLKYHALLLLDPDRCPKISLKGIYLPDVGKMLRQHGLTAQLLNYAPRLNTGKRIYLISGKLTDASGAEGTSGTNFTQTETFGFVSETGLNYCTEAAGWLISPISEENYFAITPDFSYTCNPENELLVKLLEDDTHDYDAEIAQRQAEEGGYTTAYFDFPVKAPSSVFYTFTNEKTGYDSEGELMTSAKLPHPSLELSAMPALTRSVKPYANVEGVDSYYYELAPIGDALAAGKAAIVILPEEGETKLTIDYPTIEPKLTIVEGMVFGDPDDFAVISPQAADAQAEAAESPVDNVFKGSFLAVAPEHLKAYGYENYEPSDRPVYTLAVDNDANRRKMNQTTSTLPANKAFLVGPLGDALPSGNSNSIYLGIPHSSIQTGVENVTVTDSEAEKAVFDIYGRRVSTMTPGNIYIVGGKKMLAK